MGARTACGLSGTGKLRKSTEYSVFAFSSMTSQLTFCSKKFESLSMLEFCFFLFCETASFRAGMELTELSKANSFQ